MAGLRSEAPVYPERGLVYLERDYGAPEAGVSCTWSGISCTWSGKNSAETRVNRGFLAALTFYNLMNYNNKHGCCRFTTWAKNR
jgi:hypothetical protein